MNLDQSQRLALWNDAGTPWSSHRVVEARPGSGKTFTLASYLFATVDSWSTRFKDFQGIAALSYTNVAKEEIQRRVTESRDGSQGFVHPHFVGTLDAFINKYILLPHGQTEMGCPGRHRLVGEPHSRWVPSKSLVMPENGTSSPLYFDCYTLGADGFPRVVDRTEKTIRQGVQRSATPVDGRNHSKIVRMKRAVWANGYATQADASYLALETLKGSAALTRAVIARFPVLVIDEAQDMTQAQHALIDHLRDSGHQQIVLVGDQYQAVYEWNTARPELFIAKAKDVRLWQPRVLSQTHRFGPAICKLVSDLAGDGIVVEPSASSKCVEYTDDVSVVELPKHGGKTEVYRELRAMSDRLARMTPHAGVGSPLTIALLSRSGGEVTWLDSLIRQNPRPGPKKVTINWGHPLSKDLLQVAYHLRAGDLARSANAYEALLMKKIGGSSTQEARLTMLKDIPRSSRTSPELTYRRLLLNDLSRLKERLTHSAPDLLVSGVAASLVNLNLSLIDRATVTRIQSDLGAFLEDSPTKPDRLLSALFASREERQGVPHPRHSTIALTASTVHGVKGETYDGVIFVCREQTSLCNCEKPSRKWSEILRHPIEECETKRIAYVAVSRAAQNLTIVAAGSAHEAWQDLVAG